MPDLALLMVRLWLAVVMLAHGANHARSLDGTTRWFASLGFRHPRAQALASSLGEVAVGLGLASGLLTAPAVAGLVATMAVAFWTVHRHAGFFAFARPDEGWEYVATLVVTGTAVAMLGPGRWSLDAVFGLDELLDGLVGLVIALFGVVVAAAIVAVDHRPGAD